MKDAAMPSSPEAPKAKVNIQMTADEVAGFKIGETATVTVTGKVVGVRKDSYSDGDKDHILELEDYTVSSQKTEAPAEKPVEDMDEAEMSAMPTKKLRSKLPVANREE